MTKVAVIPARGGSTRWSKSPFLYWYF